MKLTKALIAQLSLPPGKTDEIFPDDDVPGLGLRIRAGGSRNWIFQYRLGNRQRRMSIGSARALSAAEARSQAAKLHAQVRLGQDPAGERAETVARAGETFEFFLKPFLARQVERLKLRSYAEVERHLQTQAKPLHKSHFATIDRRGISILLSEIGETAGPAAANRLRASLSAFFSWAMREGLVDANPVANTNRHEESGSRERVLNNDELLAIWAATAGDEHYSAIVRLLLLLGCRRDELGSLRWREVDLHKATISLAAERTKNSRSFDIPLSPAALAILESQSRRDGREFVFGRGQGGFSGWSKSKTKLDRRAAIAPWRLHDLRRSVSTRLHDELGAQPHIVEAILGHVSGHKGGVAGVYNRAAYANDKRITLTLWAEHVLAIVEDRPIRIVAIGA